MHGSRSQCNVEGGRDSGVTHTYLGNGTYTTCRSGASTGTERGGERGGERGMQGMKDAASYNMNISSSEDAPVSYCNPMYLDTPGIKSRTGQRARTGSKVARTSGSGSSNCGIIDDSDEPTLHFSNPMYDEDSLTGGGGGGGGGGSRMGSGTGIRGGRRSVGGDENSTETGTGSRAGAGTGTGLRYDAVGRARGASLDTVDYYNPMYLTNGNININGTGSGLGKGDTTGQGQGQGQGHGLNHSHTKSPPSAKKSKYVSLNDSSPLAYQRRS